MTSTQYKILGVLRRVKGMSASRIGERVWGVSKSRIRSAKALPASKALNRMIELGWVTYWWDDYRYQYQITDAGAQAFDRRGASS